MADPVSTAASATATAAVAAEAVVSSTLSSTAAAASSPASSVITKFANSAGLVGSSWLVSSALLSTYSTTKFLKYGDDDETDLLSQFISKRSTAPSRKDDVEDYEFSRAMAAWEADALQEKRCRRQALATATSGLSQLDRATLLTLLRFSISLLLGLFAHPDVFIHVADRLRQTLQACPSFFQPAICLYIANYCNSVALHRIGIPLTYTSKCGIPLVTVYLTWLLQGRQALPNLPTLLTLIPIAVGIALSSWNSPTWNGLGFAAALVSTAAQAALIVLGKRAMEDTQVTGTDAQRVMVLVALLVTVGVSCGKYVVGRIISGQAVESDAKTNEMTSTTSSENKDPIPLPPPITPPATTPPMWLGLFAAISYHVEYCLSFMFVRLVQPITFGTCDAVRRLAIIVAGKQMFGGPKFSVVNLCGIGLALVGALLYSLLSSYSGGSFKT